MKLNKILMALLLLGVLMVGISAISAEDYTLSDGTTVTVPDGFTASEKDGVTNFVTADGSTAIQFTINEDPIDIEAGKQTQLDAGSELLGENTYNYGDVEVTEQQFQNTQGQYLTSYLFTANDQSYIITAVAPTEIPTLDDESNEINAMIAAITGEELEVEE